MKATRTTVQKTAKSGRFVPTKKMREQIPPLKPAFQSGLPPDPLFPAISESDVGTRGGVCRFS